MNKKELVKLILTGVSLAMGVAVVVLSILGELKSESGITMLGIGLFCLALSSLQKN